MTADPRIDAHIARAQPFARPLLAHVRARLHAAFGFWDRQALATGREGTAMGQYGRLTTLADLPPDAELDAQIKAMLALIAAGDRPKRAARPPKPEAAVPAVLAAALETDPQAKTMFFDRFAPSHRREYCEWVADAKRDATRDRRVAQALAWIAYGKRRNWQYER